MGEGKVYIVAIAITDNDVIEVQRMLFNQFILVMTHEDLSDNILGKVSSFPLRRKYFTLSTYLAWRATTLLGFEHFLFLGNPVK